MLLDLSAGHLGDVLLAMPAMLPGDRVIARAAHRVPGCPVDWVEPEEVPAGICVTRPATEPGRHMTDAWLLATGREPVRHELAPWRGGLTVIAPHVQALRKRWGGWDALRSHLPDAVIVGASLPRDEWMRLLARADVVICPDTGTAHMADALGVPRVVGLYADSKRDFLPYWNREHCVIRPVVAEITVGEVLEAVNG